MPAIELLTVRVPCELKRWIEDEAYRRRLSINRAVVAIFTEIAQKQASETAQEDTIHGAVGHASPA